MIHYSHLTSISHCYQSIHQFKKSLGQKSKRKSVEIKIRTRKQPTESRYSSLTRLDDLQSISDLFTYVIIT